MGRNIFEIRSFFPRVPPLLKLQRNLPKNTKEKFTFQFFFIFGFIFFDSKGSLTHRSICQIDTVLLIPILAYFMTLYVT